MSTPPKYAPKHRAPGRHKAARSRVRSSLTISTMAVVATGLVVGGGTSLSAAPTAGSAAGPDADLSSLATAGLAGAPLAAADEASETPVREPVVTRSDRRTADSAKADVLAVEAPDATNALTGTADLSGEDPRTLAKALLAEFGFGADQFGCLDSLWTKESNWTVTADNPTSDAYGIPQALPGSKMSSAGADWATNPVTQIRWGLGYIADRYGSPCSAWGHSQRMNWY